MDLVNDIDTMIRLKLSASRVLFHGKFEVPKHIVKKNRRPVFRNKRTGRAFIGKSSELKNAESYLLLQLQSLRNNHKITKPLNGALWCVLLFKYKDFYTARGTVSRHVGDLSNLLELPADCLQEAGIIENDAQIHSFDLSRRLPFDKNELEIFILTFDEKVEYASPDHNNILDID